MTTQTEKKVTLTPIGNRVVLQRVEQEETSKSGIILPDSAKKKPETATVVAVGKGKTSKDGTLIPPSVSVGDNVLIDKYSGQEVELNGEEYVIVKDDDIIAIVQE